MVPGIYIYIFTLYAALLSSQATQICIHPMSMTRVKWEIWSVNKYVYNGLFSFKTNSNDLIKVYYIIFSSNYV